MNLVDSSSEYDTDVAVLHKLKPITNVNNSSNGLSRKSSSPLTIISNASSSTTTTLTTITTTTTSTTIPTIIKTNITTTTTTTPTTTTTTNIATTNIISSSHHSSSSSCWNCWDCCGFWLSPNISTMPFDDIHEFNDGDEILNNDSNRKIKNNKKSSSSSSPSSSVRWKNWKAALGNVNITSDLKVLFDRFKHRSGSNDDDGHDRCTEIITSIYENEFFPHIDQALRVLCKVDRLSVEYYLPQLVNFVIHGGSSLVWLHKLLVDISEEYCIL
jgi:hypothetical protein